jgi:RNA polymerase sigma factor (sigma-70 family)
MCDDLSFHDLICRIRAKDEEAAVELVRKYDPFIQQGARRRLTDPELRRLVDAGDISQAVLARFFEGAAAGKFAIAQPEDLLKLLNTMAHNELTSCIRKIRAARRSSDQPQTLDPQDDDFIDPSPTPSQIVADEELMEEFSRRLSPEERQLAHLRASGRPWSEIAAEVNSSPDSLRMQLSRAIARVRRELGLVE